MDHRNKGPKYSYNKFGKIFIRKRELLVKYNFKIGVVNSFVDVAFSDIKSQLFNNYILFRITTPEVDGEQL